MKSKVISCGYNAFVWVKDISGCDLLILDQMHARKQVSALGFFIILAYKSLTLIDRMLMEPKRYNCEELLKVIPVMEKGLRASLENISEDLLNYNFASHKMTIGQLAVHTMSWPRYFLSEEPPWELTENTCRPCTYPLKLTFVEEVISDGINIMVKFLQGTNDELLEKDAKGEKGKGYILYRLQLHTLVHANQISYLRSLKEPSWDFGSYFGDMATALIGLDYHTTKDLSVRGF